MLAQHLSRAAARLLDGAPPVNFLQPDGAPSLCAPNSVSWQVFKNPVALFAGGVAAVILELAEPRVRSGVWEHSDFRRDPVARMRRTGMAAMATVYAAREFAEPLIARVGRQHAQVQGMTPAGVGYRASDPELLDWVQATASFGFLEAYHAYVRPLSAADKDRFYAEGGEAAKLYGAICAPRSKAQLDALFTVMQPALEPSPVIPEFLRIVSAAPLFPVPLRPFQRALVRAAVAIVPLGVRNIVGLGREYGLGALEGRLVRLAGLAAEHVPLPDAPPAQACRRLGLPADYLYRTASRRSAA